MTWPRRSSAATSLPPAPSTSAPIATWTTGPRASPERPADTIGTTTNAIVAGEIAFLISAST